MSNERKGSLLGLIIAVAGAFSIVAILVCAMKQYTAPPPMDEVRIKERHKALSEVRGIAEAELNSYGKIDAAKGLYRLKIAQAMMLTEQLYKDSAAARSNLIIRAEKANFVPPPPAFE